MNNEQIAIILKASNTIKNEIVYNKLREKYGNQFLDVLSNDLEEIYTFLKERNQPILDSEALGPLKVYTDGSCNAKTGDGGWAFAVFNEEKGRDDIFRSSDFEVGTTVNRMEFIAMIEAINWVISNGDISNTIFYTDSQLLTNTFNKWMDGWKRKNWKKGNGDDVMNKNLVIQLSELKDAHPQINIQWIRAHNGDYYNDLVDKLAVEARKNKRS